MLTKQESSYANTPAAASLLDQAQSPSIDGLHRLLNSVMWKMWAHLEDACARRHASMAAGLWLGWADFANFFNTEDAKREFLMGMHGFGMISSPQVVECFRSEWLYAPGRLGRRDRPPGGCAACARYPQLRATVFDLPERYSAGRRDHCLDQGR